MNKLIRVGVVALVGLSACSDPVKDAKRELEIIESTGGASADVCAAKRKLADAYLKAQDSKEYEAARLSADIQCMNTQLNRRLGISS